MYRVILADPPWQYRNRGVEGSAENAYSTMTTEDICALPIAQLAHKDSVLLLWGTWPNLPEAIKVMQAWGFRYVTGFPWIKIHGVPQTNLWGELQVKPVFGVGFWVHGTSEFVFIGKRGKAKPPKARFAGLLSENFGHSRKPDNLYTYAESMEGPYLEMFARRTRPGWDVFGNQVVGSISLPPSNNRLQPSCHSAAGRERL